VSVEPSGDAPLDPTAERVADFVSAEIGSPAAGSGERDFVRRLGRFRQVQRNRKRFTLGVAVASALVIVGLAGSRFRDRAPNSTVLSYRVDDRDPPAGGYILASQTTDALLAFSDGSRVRMAPRARGRVVEVNNRGAKFALDDGKLAVDIVHLPRAQWTFEAGPFRVSVHGTSFTVAWNPVEAVFEVRLASGHRRWMEDRKSKRLFPGGPYVLLHTLSHLMIQSLAMRCGYPASSIRERIYADSQAERFGILLYTASPDADGTLGSLVQQARHVEVHLAQALRMAAFCSHDPICAHHAPGTAMEGRWLHGAACHGCALVAEPSCEMRNDYLDRALVVPVLGVPGAALFQVLP
jgi:hypothetical protein